MPTKKTSGASAKNKTTAAKKRAPRQRVATPIAETSETLGSGAPEAAVHAVAASSGGTATAGTPAASGDRLSEVARTIGSTVGEIVTKTKHVLHRH